MGGPHSVRLQTDTTTIELMLRTQVRLGDLIVWVEKETIEELIQEIQYIRDLDSARAGDETATVFFRGVKDYEYYGLRRRDGAEVIFGQHKKAEAGRSLYSYSAKSERYKGWQTYQAK